MGTRLGIGISAFSKLKYSGSHGIVHVKMHQVALKGQSHVRMAATAFITPRWYMGWSSAIN